MQWTAPIKIHSIDASTIGDQFLHTLCVASCQGQVQGSLLMVIPSIYITSPLEVSGVSVCNERVYGIVLILRSVNIWPVYCKCISTCMLCVEATRLNLKKPSESRMIPASQTLYISLSDWITGGRRSGGWRLILKGRVLTEIQQQIQQQFQLLHTSNFLLTCFSKFTHVYITCTYIDTLFYRYMYSYKHDMYT